MKLVLALTALIAIAQPALADSGYDVLRNQITGRARIGQIDSSINQLKKQIDQLDNEKGKLDRDENLDPRQLLDLISNVHQVGRCSMDVTTNDQVTTITVQNRKGELVTATIANDRLKHADMKVQSRLDGGRAQATLIAQDLKDMSNNKSKLAITYDQNGNIQELRFQIERPGSDFEAKDCRN